VAKTHQLERQMLSAIFRPSFLTVYATADPERELARGLLGGKKHLDAVAEDDVIRMAWRSRRMPTMTPPAMLSLRAAAPGRANRRTRRRRPGSTPR
jgi:hypothetical protein